MKLIIPKNINASGTNRFPLFFFFFIIFFILFSLHGFSQDNSPYSRYGLGDLVPGTNIMNRGMAGIAAGYSDQLSINFTNPASYSSFKSFLEAKSKKVTSARTLFDVGLNFDKRTLRSTNAPERFSASNAIFSYLQLGIPVKNNWGINFGLRPVSRISYKIIRREKLIDSNTGLPIDSAITEFSGDGGTFLASVGTGFAIKNFSVGINFGYLFGNKQYAGKRAFINDSITYNNSNSKTSVSFGGIYFNGGVQYKIVINPTTSVKIGAFGNLNNNLDASQDVIRETFVRTSDNGDLRLDSVYEQKGIKGQITYPSSYGIGFVAERQQTIEKGGWLFGIDFLQSKWNRYRFFGATDLVQNNWELKIGGQLRPKPARNYWSNVAYRAGFSVGPDYIYVQQKLQQVGVSFGLGLPLFNYNRLSPGQYSVANLALEYNKRGNNNNLLKENLFRVSVGLAFSDLWFGKRKYE
ncbi:MAG: hypothetical protein M3O67_03005 [Bacteroidota bacterium]|nr:hypothetical protein [Bacteroidota bacterium]